MFATGTLLDCGDWLLVGLFGPRAVVGLRWTDGWFRYCGYGLEMRERLIWFSIDKPSEMLLNIVLNEQFLLSEKGFQISLLL